MTPLYLIHVRHALNVVGIAKRVPKFIERIIYKVENLSLFMGQTSANIVVHTYQNYDRKLYLS